MGIDLTRGFVAFPRGLTDWEWYTEPNTVRLYFHLLLTANWKEKRWQGITIHPGELVTSRAQLAKQLRMSEQSVRTALEHLQSTSCVTSRTGPRYSVITINNYAELVGSNQLINQLVTSCQPAPNQDLTKITKKTKEQSSSMAQPKPERTTTSHPCVQEFEASIGRLSANGKAELTAYADRLGTELVSAIIAKCADLGGRSWAYVRKALEEAEAQGCKSAEEYRRTNPIGGSRAKGTRVDRETLSGNDILKNATRRRPLIKKEAAKEAAQPDVPEP